ACGAADCRPAARSAAALLLEGGAAGLAGALGALAVNLDVAGGAGAALFVVGAVLGVAADGGGRAGVLTSLVHLALPPQNFCGYFPRLLFTACAVIFGGALLALYAIGDLHLSIGGNKPMDVFGGRWINY